MATYDILPLPVPTPEEQESFLFALRDAREKKLRYIQTRNDLEFALRNPMFFEELPANDILLNTISIYTKLINAVMEHAIRLSRGEIKPPRFFDPSEMSPPIVEPAPISLRRVTPPAIPTIRVPDMVGMTGDDLEFAFRCLSVGTVDNCLAGTVFLDEDDRPMPLHVSWDVAEFLALVLSGQLRLTVKPSGVSSQFGRFVSNSQFPAAGTLVASGSEVVLQFVELPV